MLKNHADYKLKVSNSLLKGFILGILGVGIIYKRNLPDPITPNTLMAQLRAQIDILNEVVSMCAQSATVYEIPIYPNGEVPELIEVKHVSGDEAISMATSAFRNFSRGKDQHHGSVYRLPGVITVDKDLRPAVERVNHVKAELQQLIKTEYPGYKERNRFCREVFPGRMMLQVYRRLFTNEREVEKVGFSWMPITRSTVKVSRADAMQMLIKRGTMLGKTKDKDGVIAAKIAFQNVSTAPQDTEYAIIKPRAPYPTTVLYYTDGVDKTKKGFVAPSLPVIVGPTTHPIHIGELSSLDTTRVRKQRKDIREAKCLYKPLNLHAFI